MTQMPWTRRSNDPDEQDDPYLDYRQWEQWMDRIVDVECRHPLGPSQGECHCNACRLYAWWESADGLIRGELYAAMVRSLEEARP